MEALAKQIWNSEELYKKIWWEYPEGYDTDEWQDGTHCGKQGIDAFRWSCFSGVLTDNLNIT